MLKKIITFINTFASIVTIVGIISIFATVYSITIESYSKRESSIYYQSRLINELAQDLLFIDLTKRITIDLSEIYRLESVLMEKPILTYKVFPSYSRKEQEYQQLLKQLKHLISQHNEETFIKKLKGISLNMDNAKSLDIKLQLIEITNQLINISQDNKEKNQ